MNQLLAAAGEAVQTEPATVIGVIVLFFFAMVLAAIALCVLVLIAQWRLFEKAGQPGWTALIPFYNHVKLLEIVNYPLWWIVLLLMPFANIIVWLLLSRRISQAFGKEDWGFATGLFLLPVVFFPILGFGKSEYSNPFPPSAPMSEAVKWTLLAAFVYMMIEMPLYSLPLAFLNALSQHATTVSDTAETEREAYRDTDSDLKRLAQSYRQAQATTTAPEPTTQTPQATSEQVDLPDQGTLDQPDHGIGEMPKPKP